MKEKPAMYIALLLLSHFAVFCTLVPLWDNTFTASHFFLACIWSTCLHGYGKLALLLKAVSPEDADK
jgi:hypothetical protein